MTAFVELIDQIYKILKALSQIQSIKVLIIADFCYACEDINKAAFFYNEAYIIC